MIVIKYAIINMFILFLFVNIGLSAQKNIGGTPYSFTEEFQNKYANNEVETYNVPKPDVAKALKIDAESNEEGPFMFALPVPVNLSMENCGTWVELDNGDCLWRLTIKGKDAMNIFCIMDDFSLPEEGLLYIYDESHEQIRGAYSSFNNRNFRTFTFLELEGNEMTLEYYEPKEVRGQGKFTITKVYYGYRDVHN